MYGHRKDYRFEAITPDLADECRRNMSALSVRADSSPGFPCRQCMRDAAVGDEMVLVAHDPFGGPSPYAAPTAIYLHATPCSSFETTSVPPEMLRTRMLSVRGFGSDHMMKQAVVVEGVELESAIETILEEPVVAYLHVHNAGPGCWNCRVVRALD